MEWLSKETLEDTDALLLYYYCFLARFILFLLNNFNVFFFK